jgi:hypothetical protein
MKIISAIAAAVPFLFLVVNDAKAADCTCQCLDRDGSVFAKPPGAKTPELCADICSRMIIDGKGLASSCPVEGKPPVKGGEKPAPADQSSR